MLSLNISFRSFSDENVPSSLVVSKTARKADNLTADEVEQHVSLWSITWSMLG